ncbi:hypothetical protein HPB47_017431, partial [Ixodes persulcatus]
PRTHTLCPHLLTTSDPFTKRDFLLPEISGVGTLTHLQREAHPPSQADASLLYRLWTGSAFTRLALHRYGRAGRVDSPECTVCGDPEDITHILLICPEYDAARKVLFATVLKAGGQTATTTRLLFPTGSRRQAWSIFRAVLEFLHQTELAERL